MPSQILNKDFKNFEKEKYELITPASKIVMRFFLSMDTKIKIQEPILMELTNGVCISILLIYCICVEAVWNNHPILCIIRKLFFNFRGYFQSCTTKK